MSPRATASSAPDRRPCDTVSTRQAANRGASAPSSAQLEHLLSCQASSVVAFTSGRAAPRRLLI